MSIVNLDNEFSILEVSGIDAKTYLQGQLTNDLNLLSNKQFIYALHLNNKGRALAGFIITKPSDDTYHLITVKEIIPLILTRLKMYVLRSKVQMRELTELSLMYSTNSCAGHYAVSLTASDCLSITDKSMITTDHIQNWHKFLIRQNIPFIYPATFEQFIPQHISYDQIGGVSFTKGCYTGQEIVARTHYLGKAKRQMYRFKCSTTVQIGQSITSPIMDNQAVGVVVDTTLIDNYSIGLASIQIDSIASAFIANIKLDVSEIQFEQ